MCYSPDNPDKAMKVYKHAVTRLKTKLKRFRDPEYSLKTFAAGVLHHLEECGLDSVIMLQDTLAVAEAMSRDSILYLCNAIMTK